MTAWWYWCTTISLSANAVQLTFIVLTIKELRETKRIRQGEADQCR